MDILVTGYQMGKKLDIVNKDMDFPMDNTLVLKQLQHQASPWVGELKHGC